MRIDQRGADMVCGSSAFLQACCTAQIDQLSRLTRRTEFDFRMVAPSTLHELCKPGRKRMDWESVYAFLHACGVRDSETFTVWKDAYWEVHTAPGTPDRQASSSPSPSDHGEQTARPAWRWSMIVIIAGLLLLLSAAAYVWLR